MEDIWNFRNALCLQEAQARPDGMQDNWALLQLPRCCPFLHEQLPYIWKLCLLLWANLANAPQERGEKAVNGHLVGDSTVLDMCEHAVVARCPGVCRSQHVTSMPFRASTVWVTQILQRSKHELSRPRRHERQVLTAHQCESQSDSHVCRRSVLALGVAGLCMTQRAQTADAETALPPELRKQCSYPVLKTASGSQLVPSHWMHADCM